MMANSSLWWILHTQAVTSLFFNWTFLPGIWPLCSASHEMDFPSFHCALVSLFVSFVLSCYTPPNDFLLPIGQLFLWLLSWNLLQGASALKGRRVLACGGRWLGLGLDILGLLWGWFASFPWSVKWIQYCAPRNNSQSHIDQVSSIKNVHKVAHNFLFLPFKYLHHP